MTNTRTKPLQIVAPINAQSLDRPIMTLFYAQLSRVALFQLLPTGVPVAILDRTEHLSSKLRRAI